MCSVRVFQEKSRSALTEGVLEMKYEAFHSRELLYCDSTTMVLQGTSFKSNKSKMDK